MCNHRKLIQLKLAINLFFFTSYYSKIFRRIRTINFDNKKKCMDVDYIEHWRNICVEEYNELGARTP